MESQGREKVARDDRNRPRASALIPSRKCSPKIVFSAFSPKRHEEVAEPEPVSLLPGVSLLR